MKKKKKWGKVDEGKCIVKCQVEVEFVAGQVFSQGMVRNNRLESKVAGKGEAGFLV